MNSEMENEKMSDYKTLVGRVTDSTPESLLYGEYRGWVEIDSTTGEFLRNLEPRDVEAMILGDPIYSEEYHDLRPRRDRPQVKVVGE